MWRERCKGRCWGSCFLEVGVSSPESHSLKRWLNFCQSGVPPSQFFPKCASLPIVWLPTLFPASLRCSGHGVAWAGGWMKVLLGQLSSLSCSPIGLPQLAISHHCLVILKEEASRSWKGWETRAFPTAPKEFSPDTPWCRLGESQLDWIYWISNPLENSEITSLSYAKSESVWLLVTAATGN